MSGDHLQLLGGSLIDTVACLYLKETCSQHRDAFEPLPCSHLTSPNHNWAFPYVTKITLLAVLVRFKSIFDIVIIISDETYDLQFYLHLARCK